MEHRNEQGEQATCNHLVRSPERGTSKSRPTRRDTDPCLPDSELRRSRDVVDQANAATHSLLVSFATLVVSVAGRSVRAEGWIPSNQSGCYTRRRVFGAGCNSSPAVCLVRQASPRALAVCKVSRSGAMPEPTVTVRMKEDADSYVGSRIGSARRRLHSP